MSMAPSAPINSEFNEFAPSLTIDGHRLFFQSNRPGGFGGFDLYMSRRRDKRDDFDWREPVNLGGAINTPAGESRPSFSWNADRLLFGRAPGPEGSSDIYLATRER